MATEGTARRSRNPRESATDEHRCAPMKRSNHKERKEPRKRRRSLQDNKISGNSSTENARNRRKRLRFARIVVQKRAGNLRGKTRIRGRVVQISHPNPLWTPRATPWR